MKTLWLDLQAHWCVKLLALPWNDAIIFFLLVSTLEFKDVGPFLRAKLDAFSAVHGLDLLDEYVFDALVSTTILDVIEVDSGVEDTFLFREEELEIWPYVFFELHHSFLLVFEDEFGLVID